MPRLGTRIYSNSAHVTKFRVRTGDRGGGVATAMLSAITALEGLLPLLPPEAVLVHVIGPTLSPDGAHTAPTVPVQLLLAPDVHTLASPQLLNRVAGLLLQVRAHVMSSICGNGVACDS